MAERLLIGSEDPLHKKVVSSSSDVRWTSPTSAKQAPKSTATPPSRAPNVVPGQRNKGGEPLLTRFLYGLLSFFTSVPLEKGYSQMDWLRLTRQHPNLNGLNGKPPRKDITMEEVRQHGNLSDAWTVFNGKVYAITPYLKFHPGGADILAKVAGKDGTSLFMKYHPWVNLNALMAACLVGTLAPPPQQEKAAREIQEARRVKEQQKQREQRQVPEETSGQQQQEQQQHPQQAQQEGKQQLDKQQPESEMQQPEMQQQQAHVGLPPAEPEQPGAQTPSQDQSGK
mmetsp:Transcript_10308/g.22135  ORF Transcript_10308/g.22135 Transcript_10308/m.22135 type:complete len:283 (+) Transcript_10308:260-1108(+)|eukprot:CAMPEP_0202902186 /NCGR_PEP_ID=MMETSP1392-20130828/16709_1 /ASSEMBLY_ACC=CAM_ASM_000868 /TAXON_ID=225041 /ORGANISM="Chlamydomonas chlamydogama, Strain SAG 11-48b" /LENGTH=282 /DNA_ID=CAMNT_0049588915 /DNA_START=220 /DNA_END=1068 /DNA_ORIENTATION=-